MTGLHERTHVPTSVKTKWTAGLKRKLIELCAALALAGLCSAGLAAQSLQSGPAQACSQAAPVAGHEGSCKDLSSLPVAAQRTISAALGGDDTRYRITTSGGGAHAVNPQHALAVDFTRQGVKVRSETARWGLELRGYGYGDALLLLSKAAPQASANRVEYRRGALTEWYVNGPIGLEQGFTLAEPPGQANGAPLTVALALSGDLTAALDPGGTALTLTRRDWQAALRYTGLMAYDATGRELRAWLELRGKQLLLHVDDSGARYPLVIDPFVQQARLTASDGATGDQFGYSVAISADTVVVGAPTAKVGSNSAQGAAYVFVKPGTGWATTSSFDAKLTASDGAGNDVFGDSVAISGETVMVGAIQATIGTNIQQGAAYVFVKPGTGWATSTETAKLTASDGRGSDNFGFVAISGDTVVVGAPFGNSGRQGAAYVFLKPGTGWATTSSFDAKLTASDGGGNNLFGISVAISGDTVVAGAPFATVGSNSLQGAAYVFVKPGTGWATTSTFDAKLTASDGAAGDQFGRSVAISGDTVVVGALFAKIGSNSAQGAAYVFVKPGTGWATTATFDAKLTASDGGANNVFGISVAISGDTVVVGSGQGIGAAYVFVKPGTGWATTSTFDAKLTAPADAGVNSSFGFSLAISGNTVVVGAARATFPQSLGAAYVFSNLNLAPTATGVSISGTPKAGQLLTGNYTYSDVDGDLEGASTYRWLLDGTTLIGSALTYSVIAADVGHSITFEVTPVAATGTSPGTAATSSGVTILNSAPTATAVSISGTAAVGQLLTGHYTYSDVDGDAQGTSTFRWLRDGTTAVGTSATYTVVAADLTHTITFEVTPVAATGTSPGTAATSSGVTILNSAPTATAVSISGTAAVGQLLTGHYTYSDVDGDAQGTSTFRWLRDGTTAVGTSATYTVVAADLTHTITFEVTPVAATGTSPGTAVTSAGVSIVNVAPVVSSNNSSLAVQYSDAITTTTISATDVDSAGNSLVASVSWKKSTDLSFATTTPLGGITLTTLSNNTSAPGSHSWTLAGKALVSAGTYIIRVTVTDGLATSYTDVTTTVTQENASVQYTGDTIAQVSTNLTLRATVWDSAAAGYTGSNPETGASATIGDITKMWVEFDIYSAGSCGSGTPAILRAPVLDTGTSGDGIGTASANYTSSSESTYCVIPILVAGSGGGVNQFYSAPDAQPAGIVFYLNSGQFATGGGWINDPSGSHGNFGFNARYATNGSPKGQFVYIYRGLYNGIAADFIIKSNALSGLLFTPGNFPISSTLQGKASIQVNQASNGTLLYGDGNATFSATVSDSGQATGTGDTLSLVVYDKNGVPYKNVPVSGVQGGNVVVHNK